MSEKKDLEVLEPQYGFWEVQICVNVEDSETGKIKKTKEFHLIDAQNPQDVNQKAAQEMDGTMWEWSIESCKKSKLNYVY